MPTDRRSVLKASGIAAVLGTTGLAGCSGILGGGGGGVTSWQYAPSKLAPAGNAFFGSANLKTLYKARQQLPESTRQSFESAQNSPVKPSQLKAMSGVAGAEVSTQGQSMSGFGSMVMTGSFKKSTVTDAIQQQSQGQQVQQVGTYKGFTLYRSGEGTTVGQISARAPQNTSAMVAVGKGAMLVGGAGSQGGSKPVDSRQAVEAMIDAKNGNMARLRSSNKMAKKLAKQLGGATVQFGAVIDPAITEQMSSGSAGMTGRFAKGMRAGGGAMQINGKTTTFKGVLVYESSQAAKETGLTGMANMFASRLEKRPGIKKVSASQNGAAIVVTVKGDTKTLLSQGTGMGGTGSGATTSLDAADLDAF